MISVVQIACSNATQQGGRNVQQGHQTRIKYGEIISKAHEIVEYQLDCEKKNAEGKKMNTGLS